MKSKTTTRLTAGMGVLLVFLGRASIGAGQQLAENPTINTTVPVNAYPGLCLVRDQAEACKNMMGGLSRLQVDNCESCSKAGEPCAGDQFVRPNIALNDQQYEKNRAVTFRNQHAKGDKQALSNLIVCGKIGVCDQPCKEVDHDGQVIPYCPPTRRTVYLPFFDLSIDCEPSKMVLLPPALSPEPSPEPIREPVREPVSPVPPVQRPVPVFPPPSFDPYAIPRGY